MGLDYYYHGYTHDIPSQFDYKLSFSGLESMNWETGKWSHRERLPVRNWKEMLK
jgi:arginyl-tRNA--protein-N-Asp/Glu arginylyltransferase